MWVGGWVGDTGRAGGREKDGSMGTPQGIQVAAMGIPWGLRRGSGGLRRGSAHKNMGFRGDSVGIRGTPWGLRRDSAMRVEKAVLFSLYVL